MTHLPFDPVKPIRGGKPLDEFYHTLASDVRWVCQAKLNGQRVIWDPPTSEPGCLWSRRGLRVYRAPEVAKALRSVSVRLDGELILGSGGRADYYVFDLPDHKGNLDDRWSCLESIVAELGSAHSCVWLCPSGVTWEEVTPSGWEGVVFKRRDSFYPRGNKPDTTTSNWIKYRAEWL
jgi:ATP-dependent DNA ligase